MALLKPFLTKEVSSHRSNSVQASIFMKCLKAILNCFDDDLDKLNEGTETPNRAPDRD